MIDKQKILNQIILELKRELETLIKSAHTAREEAINEESKSENKYDTRGLEASYLAGAQAKRAGDLERRLNILKQINPRNFNSQSSIAGTALIEILIDGEEVRWFFFLPHIGGLKLNIENMSIYTISHESPIGEQIFGGKVGDCFERKIRECNKEYEIISVS